LVIPKVCVLLLSLSTNANNRQMNTTSNFWNSVDGIFPAIFQQSIIKCDFCDGAFDEELMDKVDGYTLCSCCKQDYEQDQKDNAVLAEANLINIKYSGDVNAPF
jgi:hypothetical protein